jgi:hypothetical protein
MRTMTRAAALLPMLVAVLAACGSTEPEPPPDRPVGDPLEVWLLEDGFVRYEGERMPVEDFVYEVRLRCRAADRSAMPWLRVIAPRSEQLATARMVDEIRRQAWDAGVQHVEFELEDS